MTKIIQHIFKIIFYILILSYLIIILFSGSYSCVINKSLNIEKINPFLTSCQIPFFYEKETIKVQSIITRTNLYNILKTESLNGIIKEVNEEYKQFYGKKSLFEKVSKYNKLFIFEEASNETEFQILLYQDDLKEIPYHKMSAGYTRSGMEIFEDEEFSYLEAVKSSEDQLNDHFETEIRILRSNITKTIDIQERDSKGYVRKLLIDGTVVEGEEFIFDMNLPSSHFYIGYDDRNIIFKCRGSGHGLGFSQFGGNIRAKQGDSYEDILKKYFPKMDLAQKNNIL